MSQSADPAQPDLAKKAGKSGRILELDAIRALSCLNLMLFHFTWVYHHKYGFETDLGFTFPYGKYGVQLFFMLSGLVNAMTLLSKRNPGDFLAARFIRILPSYWLVIALNVCLFAMLPMYDHPVQFNETAANLTTLPNLFGFENMEPVTWTLQNRDAVLCISDGGVLAGSAGPPVKNHDGSNGWLPDPGSHLHLV